MKFLSQAKAARFTAIGVGTRSIDYLPREGGRYESMAQHSRRDPLV